jgi:hypothetical protein
MPQFPTANGHGWPTNAGSYHVQCATNLLLPVVWQRFSGNPATTAGNFHQAIGQPVGCRSPPSSILNLPSSLSQSRHLLAGSTCRGESRNAGEDWSATKTGQPSLESYGRQEKLK